MRSETMLVCNRNDGPEFKGAFFKLKDEIVPNRCKLQSLLAVSVTVPVYTNTENLIKWRTDLQNKTPKFIEMVEKLRSGYAPIWDCHNSPQPSLLHCYRNGRLNMVYLTLKGATSPQA